MVKVPKSQLGERQSYPTLVSDLYSSGCFPDAKTISGIWVPDQMFSSIPIYFQAIYSLNSYH